MRFGSSFGGVLGRFLEAFWAILGGFGRFGRGVKKKIKFEAEVESDKEGKFRETRGAGGMAVGS